MFLLYARIERRIPPASAILRSSFYILHSRRATVSGGYRPIPAPKKDNQHTNEMRYKLTTLLALASLSSQAQKIDFNLSGKENTSTEDGFTSWSFGRTTNPQTKSFDGVTIKVEAVTGSGFAGNGCNCNWWKDGVTKHSKLISDAVYPVILDAGNNYSASTSSPMGVKFTITGLSAGTHTLAAYHNNTDGISSPGYPDICVKINGETVQNGVKQSIRARKLDDAGMSYVKFSVSEGETITVEYASDPKAGASYINNYVAVNALIFDRPNPKTQAVCISPAHLDSHADCDKGTATLSWNGGSSAVKHRILFGSDPENLAVLTETTATSAVTPALSALNTYYWRVDEIDKDNNVYEGDVWTFRPRHLAFPGAEGYGRYAIGGRGGTVYHVTSLDDDVDSPAEGTFRYGITKVKGPRTIVFDVCGYITLKGRLTCSDPYVTVAGQTAPGEGITFRGAPLGFASDGITRFIRSYRGYAGTKDGPSTVEQNKGLDGIGMAGNDNSILDHCSISWTTDEGFSSRNAKNITLQRTMISEALNCADHPNYSSGTCHGYAATIGSGQGYGVGSFHHNLLAHCEGRNWSLSGGLDGSGYYDGAHDVFNNVVYNWGKRATDGGTHELNFVNNYYKMGPATTQTLLLRHQFEGTGKGSQAAYVSGNVRVATNGTMTQDAENVTYKYELSGGQQLTWKPWNDKPFFESLAVIETAEAAYRNVLSDVGCNLPLLNSHDRRMVTETYIGTTSTVGSKTGKRGLIDREWDAEGYVAIEELARPDDFDTDKDGMPDWWERLNGLDPNVPDNNTDADGDGYTALEDYLNWMAQPHFEVSLGKSVEIDLMPYFAGYPSTASFSIVEGDNASISGQKIAISSANSESIASVKVKAEYDGVSLVRTFNIHYSDLSTGIIDLPAAVPAQSSPAIYNLSGQRVTSDYRGIVIRNGRKMVNK